MELLPIVLVLLSVAFIAQSQAFTLSSRNAAARSMFLRQMLDRYQPEMDAPDHFLQRRFDLTFEEPLKPAKRNNAEVVNHIIKNFGALDRLGDVGK